MHKDIAAKAEHPQANETPRYYTLFFFFFPGFSRQPMFPLLLAEGRWLCQRLQAIFCDVLGHYFQVTQSVKMTRLEGIK